MLQKLKKQEDKACYKLLVESGTATVEQLDDLLRKRTDSNESFADYVVRSGLIGEDDLLEKFADSQDTRVVSLKSLEIDRALIKRVPVKFATYYRIFPVKLEGRKLIVAIDHLIDVHTMDEVRFGLGYDLEIVFAPGDEIESMLKEYYGVGAATVEKIISQQPKKKIQVASEQPPKVEDIGEDAEKASVIQLVNQIIFEAYQKRASDIHIEPNKGKVRIRYRIDGVLHEAGVPAEMDQFLVPILSRFKIMANLNIVEKRLPQDGKSHVKAGEQSLDLRISSLPTPHGESLVIRILSAKQDFNLGQLGFHPGNLSKFKELLSRPNGVIFVTGPTGSGKSTTLYGALKSIDTVRRKVITIEDPIEYEMSGITQVQVLPEIGLTFAQGLRSMLRHDPDIMMVGEVRDLETADIAIRASLTGHLMLSTLHTNDAASGITRLMDIGVEPYLISSSVLGFLAQRLVRVICPECKEEDTETLPEVKQVILRELGLSLNEKVTLYRGKGCRRCNQTGFSGRHAIHELLIITEPLRKMIFNRASSDEIKQFARRQGMLTLRQDGWQKVMEGITTPQEVLYATPPDTVEIQSESEEVALNADSQAVASNPVTTERFIAPVPVAEQGESDDSFIERRKYTRVSVMLHLIFRMVDIKAASEHSVELNQEDWDGEGKALNLSAGGIAFKTSTHLYPGDLLDLKIKLNEREPAIECIGKVLRVRSQSDPTGAEIFNIAVLFLAIHSADRTRIESFCSTSE